MTNDGFIRYQADKGRAIKAANESAERAKRERNMVQFTAIPRVDVARRVVRLETGNFWTVYQIAEVGPTWRVSYVPEASRPLEGLTPGQFGKALLLVDPQARELCDAALTAYLQAAGLTDRGYFNWDYRASLGPDGNIRSDISPAAQAEARALRRMDAKRQGIVTATRREVAWEQAKEGV